MTTDAGRALVRTAPQQIAVARMIVLDWHDGPREGFIEFSQPPSSWYFRAYASAVGADERDDLLFTLARVPDGAVDELTRALSSLEPSAGPIWVPDWVFESEQEHRAADQLIGDLTATAGQPEIVVRSGSLRSITAVWQVVAR